MGFGTGLGSPEFLDFALLMALLSLVILFSPAAKDLSVDFPLARRRSGLSPLLLNRRGGSGESGPDLAARGAAPEVAPEGRPPRKK